MKQGVNAIIVTNFLGPGAEEKGMINGVRHGLEATATNAVPGIRGEVAIVMFVLGMRKDTDSSTK